MEASSIVVLNPRPPFRLEPTVRVLQRRPSNRVDVWRDGRYWRVLPAGAGNALVEVAESGTAEAPALTLRFHEAALGEVDRRQMADTMRGILGTDVDTAPFQRLAAGDPILSRSAGALYGLKPPRFPSLMETFVNVVVFQQISLNAALAITGRLVQQYGDRVEQEGQAYYAFPTASVLSAVAVDDLRRVGLTQRKAEAVHALAGMVASGELSFEGVAALSSDEAVARLLSLPGIGRWSAELVLLRGLGRLDVFPSGDAGIRRALGLLYGLPAAAGSDEERELATRFGPYRGMLYFFVVGARLHALGVLSDHGPGS